MGKLICEKRVTVAEPECWYNQPDVKVILFEIEKGVDIGVRIFFESIDDFAVYQDVDDWEQKANIDWAKEYLYDKIPENVSLQWLYEHGYKPY